MAANCTLEVESLYHIIFTSSHLSRHTDLHDQVEKIRVCGTYTVLDAAKKAAHRVLSEAGYEKEWFTDYNTKQDDFIAHGIKRRVGLIVLAKASNGTIFRITVATTPNLQAFRDDEDHKINEPLYHVVQTNVLYSEDDTREARETNIEGSFLTYEQARKFASGVLLDTECGVTKESFAKYDEAEPNETDCGYGENVVAHVVGQNGENILVSVLLGQEMESVRLAEAAIRIR